MGKIYVHTKHLQQSKNQQNKLLNFYQCFAATQHNLGPNQDKLLDVVKIVLKCSNLYI